MAMIEKIAFFGHEKALFGILHPVNEATDTKPALLFINSGIISRSGPHRLYCKMARAFQQAGYVSLRMDLSGLGDSAAAATPLGYEQQGILDVSAAIDHLQTLGATQNGVIAIGLCSGSEHAYKAALEDSRIGGLVLLDPHSYPSIRSRVDKALLKARDKERWGRVVSRVTARAAKGMQDTDDTAVAFSAVIDRPDPPREEWAEALEILTGRGTDIYIRYTRFVEEDLTKPEHFFEAFDDTKLHGRVHVDVDRDADHTYTPIITQVRMIDALLSWLNTREQAKS